MKTLQLSQKAKVLRPPVELTPAFLTLVVILVTGCIRHSLSLSETAWRRTIVGKLTSQSRSPTGSRPGPMLVDHPAAFGLGRESALGGGPKSSAGPSFGEAISDYADEIARARNSASWLRRCRIVSIKSSVNSASSLGFAVRRGSSPFAAISQGRHGRFRAGLEAGCCILGHRAHGLGVPVSRPFWTFSERPVREEGPRRPIAVVGVPAANGRIEPFATDATPRENGRDAR